MSINEPVRRLRMRTTKYSTKSCDMWPDSVIESPQNQQIEGFVA
jgi:hypothetical protein